VVKKVLHSQPVQKSGNIVRTVLIASGMVIAIFAAVLVMVDVVSERVGFYLVVVTLIAFGFALLDFDVDDDD
jgi:energy-converting hydrogenase Eha subunit C